MARPEAAPKTALGARLREIRRSIGDPERDEIAARLGISKNTLASYERGETEPTTTVLASYREKLGISVTWIVTGEGAMFDDPSKIKKPAVEVDAGTAQTLVSAVKEITKAASSLVNFNERNYTPMPKMLKYYPYEASAGGGRVILNEDEGFDLDVEALLSDLLGLDPEKVFLLRVKGDSMSPTLMDGDLVLVEKISRDIQDGEIGVFSDDGHLYIKRAFWQPDTSLSWVSDNEDPRFAPINIFGPDFDLKPTLGRVAWLWRRA
ncbi:XRE family transcriptional regulator [Oryzifoliimicrobium ureilyticus]|uniref:XRE family transcriptional regulator n=1 Tax=Oryzifoliimicrobium ureilyticus TaxID=3113724 RepID=UPI0030761F4F